MWVLLGIYFFDVNIDVVIWLSNDVDGWYIIVDVVCLICIGLVIELMMVSGLLEGGMIDLLVFGFYIF